ncbi:MAG TPA: SHOCT domain-containing protein [Thermoleophilia bacterium]
MGIGMILVLVAVVLLVVYLVRGMTNQRTQTQPPAYYGAPPAQQTPEQRGAESPRDIVQRRYASGEIEREEYLEKLKDL